MNPFDYVNAINDTKKNLMVGTDNDELAEKGYTPFMVNKSLSYFIDTILYANEINEYAHIDNKLQFEYYLNGIPKKKRFSKWAKKEKSDDLDIICEYYGCNYTRAAEIHKIINITNIDFMKQKLQKGGVIKNE
jgi:hypothetical protein